MPVAESERCFITDTQMPSRPGITHLLASYAAVVLLTCLALRQQYYAHRHHLTAWLGGGMGMFATVDRIDHRVTRIYMTLDDGRELPVELPGKWSIVEQEMRVRIMPTENRLSAFAVELGRGRWQEIQRDGHPLVVTYAGQDVALQLKCRSLRVEVWRAAFDSATRTASMVRLGVHTWSPPDEPTRGAR